MQLIKKFFPALFVLASTMACKKEVVPIDNNPFNNLNLCDPTGFPDQVGDCQIQSITYLSPYYTAERKDSFVYDDNERLIAFYKIVYGNLELYTYEYEEECSAVTKYFHYTSPSPPHKVPYQKDYYNDKKLAYRVYYDYSASGNISYESAYAYEGSKVTGYYIKKPTGLIYHKIQLDAKGNVELIEQKQINATFPGFLPGAFHTYGHARNPLYQMPLVSELEYFFSPNTISEIAGEKYGTITTNHLNYITSRYDSLLFNSGSMDSIYYRYKCH